MKLFTTAHTMTTQQINTINSVKSQIQKVTPWATKERAYTNCVGYPSNWVVFLLSDNEENYFAHLVIDADGRIQIGEYDAYNTVPNVER